MDNNCDPQNQVGKYYSSMEWKVWISSKEVTRLSQATHIAWSSAAVTAIFPQLPV